MTPTARTALYAVLGRPIAHSLSPALHNAAFRAEGRDAIDLAFDVGVDELKAALDGLEAIGAVGANVTSPLKAGAFAWAKHSTEAASRAGAANTIRFAADGAVAHNTDGDGFVRFLSQMGIAVGGVPVVLLGGGGAAAGLAPALADAGAARVACVTRDRARAATYAGLAAIERVVRGGKDAEACVRGARIVVQCTPLGGGADGEEPCPPSWLDAGAVAVDLRYHPAETPWLSAVRARGVRAANGLGMLLEQALLAQAFWHGSEPPRSALEEAVGWSDPFSPGG